MAARLRVGLVVLLVVLCHGGAVAARPSTAAAAFDEGLGHYRRKEFTEAAEAFFRAYRLEPSADAAYNAGLAWQLSARPALAATAYEIALGLGLGAEAAADARSRLGKLTVELGRIEISAPDGAKVRVDPFVLPASGAIFYLEPGRAIVSVTLRNGSLRVRAVRAVAGQTTVLLVEEADPSSEAREPGSALPPSGDDDAGSYRTAGWISIGVAAAAAGAAVFLGLKTLAARDEYDASGHRDADARARADRGEDQTNVAWVIAGVAAVAGVGLVVLAPSGNGGSSARAAPRGLVLTGRFH